MQFIKNIFWNSGERRPRALWRLILQLIILILIALPSQIIIGMAAVLIFTAQGSISFDQLGDPRTGPQTVQNTLMESPVLVTSSTLALFVTILVSVWLAGRFLDRRRFADFGLHINKNWWADFGFGLFLGAFLMLFIFLVELAAGWVTVTGTFVTDIPGAAFLTAMLPALVIFLAVGFHEELFSRGYQLRNIAEGLSGRLMGPRVAILVATLLSSAVFGVLHIGNPNASFISTFNIFLAGASVLGMGYLLTGELAIPIGVHITWNFFQGNVFGFPVSGGNYHWATFIAVQQGGPDAWTGGAFGPEAGLLGVTAMLLGGLLISLWVRWRYGRVGLHVGVAEAFGRTEEQANE